MCLPPHFECTPFDGTAMSSQFRSAGRTDIGRHRTANEDSILLMPEQSLFAVADGMGGHRGGRVASQMVTSELGRIVREADEPLDHLALREALSEVNRRVFETGEKNEELHAMGSTCVVVSIIGSTLHMAHVGDSRCYLVQGKEARQLTSDHRAIQPMIDQGAITEQESRVHPLRNVLTRSVGVEPKVEVESTTLQLSAGDRLVLCSDGLSDMLTLPEIAAEVGSGSDLEKMVERLVAGANGAGGSDNISVIVIEYAGD